MIQKIKGNDYIKKRRIDRFAAKGPENRRGGNAALSQLGQLLLLTSDSGIVEVLRDIRNDELKHSNLVQKLFRILESETVSKS